MAAGVVRLLVLGLLCVLPISAHADASLPSPLRTQDVAALAGARRSEIAAARARARAAAQRPAIVSALEEPTVSLSIDHLPLRAMGVEWSASFEQAFPLSRIRGNRRRAAEAGARREAANAERVARDVELDAVRAFWMVAEARASAEIAVRQYALAEQLVAAALARYTAGTGAQADVLRAQTERARLDAEVMLNTSLSREADAPIPELETGVPEAEPPPGDVVARGAQRRSELRAGRAEVEQAEAEVRVMRSMYAPMAMVRTGPAYTMADGAGWMLMVGMSVPLWRGKLRAGVAEARAMVDMASADLDAMRRMADGEARGAREDVAAARERYRAWRDDIVPRAEQAMAPTLAAYAVGQVPLVSVVEAAQLLWTSQRELVAARTALGLAWARLRRAAGEEVTP